MQAKTMNRQVR